MRPMLSCAFLVLIARAPVYGQESTRTNMMNALATCAGCQISVAPTWRSQPNDPNVPTADFYVETGSALWAMGGFAGETLAQFSMTEARSTLHTLPAGALGISGDQIHGATLDPSGDTLVITHTESVGYFSPRDLTHYRAFVPTVPTGFGIVMMTDGTVVIPNSPFPDYSGAQGNLLHRFGPDGKHLGSYLPVTPELRGAYFPLARGNEPSTVWALLPMPKGFAAEQWDVEKASRMRRFQFNADWWYTNPFSTADIEAIPPDRRADSDALKPTTGAVAAYDDRSYLWVAIRHPDESWRRALGGQLPVANELFDSFLVALDRTTGAVLAGYGFDEFAVGFTNLGTLVLIGSDADGARFIKLCKYSLMDRSRGG